MSDKPISVGDLVWVIKGTLCCNDIRSIGRVFRVIGGIRSALNKCDGCGKMRAQTNTDYVTLDNGNSCERIRLKRIPPLSELEGQKQKEDLREPA